MSRQQGSFRLGWAAAYVLGFAAMGVIVAGGLDYYRTPLLERAHHAGYWTWKAGGRVGHKLGVVGSSMMVLMLLYSLRKRVAALRRLGPLSRWLDVHIFLGVFGPLLVVHLYQWRKGSELAVFELPRPARYALYGLVFYLVLLFGDFEGAQFIYFQF